MTPFLSATDHTDALPLDYMVPAASVCVSSQAAVTGVGQDRLSHSQREAEDELDRVIVELGDRMVVAMKDGDPEGARMYQDRMYAAIKSRSPSHQERLSAEIERRLDEGCCYFATQGDQARAELERKAA